MSFRFNLFLSISFALHLFVIIFVSYVTEKKDLNNKYVQSINLKFSNFQRFDQEIDPSKVFQEKKYGTKNKYSKKLDTKNITPSVAGSYVSSWQRKVETIGNLNYPSFLKSREFSSKLTLSVTIGNDGSLLDYALIKSSGDNKLDSAAIQIIELAFPFKNFPEEMANFSEITIIRDWQFGNQDS
jgi:TonB family protein